MTNFAVRGHRSLNVTFRISDNSATGTIKAVFTASSCDSFSEIGSITDDRILAANIWLFFWQYSWWLCFCRRVAIDCSFLGTQSSRSSTITVTTLWLKYKWGKSANCWNFQDRTWLLIAPSPLCTFLTNSQCCAAITNCKRMPRHPYALYVGVTMDHNMPVDGSLQQAAWCGLLFFCLNLGSHIMRWSVERSDQLA